MKGALVFLGVFAIVLIITLGSPTIPPGRQIYDAVGGADIDYPILGISITTLVPAVFNGIIYGVIVWLVYSVLASATGRGKKQQVKPKVNVRVQYQTNRAQTPFTSDIEKPMAVPISSIEGIGSVFSEKLFAVGVKTSSDLLKAGKTSQRRASLATKAGISPKLILEWVNLADLIRIKGVSEEYSDLLEDAGVNTVPELARRNPENLYVKLQEVNEEKELVRRLPSASMVAEWVEQAKKLPRIVEY